MDGKGALLRIVVEFHLRGVEASLAFDEVADGGILDDHLGPERVARETEKVGAMVGGDFDDDVSPAGDDVFGLENLMVGEGVGNNLI